MLDRRSFLAGAAAAASISAAPPSAARAAGADWSQDIQLLQRAYELLHPGLYRYSAPAEVAARFQDLEQFFKATPSRGAAYLELSAMLATIKCGHTYANFYNQSDAVAEELFPKTGLPFQFRWLDGAMVVTRNFSGDARLAPGSEVLAVDGVRSRRILKSLMPYARADGSNDAKRRTLLELRGGDKFETFDIFHALRFGPAPGAYRVGVRALGAARPETIEVPALDVAARRAARDVAAPPDNPLGWRFSWPAERIALLATPDWTSYNTDWDWRAFISTAFAQLNDRGATGLVVDLRGNEGGEDCGNEIIARLVDKDLHVDLYERRVRYRKTPADLDPFLDTWDKSFRDWGDAARPLDDRYFKLTRYDDDSEGDVIAARGPRFTGKVAVLVDSQISSATFEFSRIMRDARLATLIGEPTGGNRRGINGGAFFFLRLPASGLEADVPLIGTFPKTAQPDAGLLPDISAAPTAADIAGGRDRALETALAFLSS